MYTYPNYFRQVVLVRAVKSKTIIRESSRVIQGASRAANSNSKTNRSFPDFRGELYEAITDRTVRTIGLGRQIVCESSGGRNTGNEKGEARARAGVNVSETMVASVRRARNSVRKFCATTTTSVNVSASEFPSAFLLDFFLLFSVFFLSPFVSVYRFVFNVNVVNSSETLIKNICLFRLLTGTQLFSSYCRVRYNSGPSTLHTTITTPTIPIAQWIRYNFDRIIAHNGNEIRGELGNRPGPIYKI